MSDVIRERETNPEQEKAAMLDKFRRSRNNYLDDLPEEIVNFSNPKYYSYKCRGNFWDMVLSDIEFLTTSHLVSDESSLKQLEDYMKYIESVDFSKKSQRKK